MAIVPLLGHAPLVDHFSRSIAAGTLPQSLLLHGEAGVGKQRLALWLASALLCERVPTPCGNCRQCRYMADLTHPDLVWAFPRPRPKDSDHDADDAKLDLAEAIRDRVAAGGLYAAPGGMEAIFIATVHFLVRSAALSPAMARRKVIVVGDAERMVAQEGSEAAANAFLKLLEEPGPGTHVILTSSAPGTLLPTIRSRVVSLRVPRLSSEEIERWLATPVPPHGRPVAEVLAEHGLAGNRARWVEAAAGAPGRLLSSTTNTTATEAARRLIAAATSGSREREARLALSQSASGARGPFTDLLEALAVELRGSLQTAVTADRPVLARRVAVAIEKVEEAKELAHGNGNPQLITAGLLTVLHEAMAPR